MKDRIKPNIAFFGTSQFSVVMLEKLEEAGLTPSCIITAPDKPQGRKMILTPPPVKVWASSREMNVLQPEKLDDGFISSLGGTSYDLFVVAAYSKLLPKKVLDLPVYGTLNVHPSLLPLYRGASPLQYQILDGAEYVGVTIMLIDEKMDHGPILAQEALPMPRGDGEHPLPTCGELAGILADIGGDLLTATIPRVVEEEIAPQQQDHEAASYTKPIRKEDGFIDLADDPELNYRKIRALTPNPGAYYFHTTKKGDIRVKITDAIVKNGELVITRVVPAGKNEMAYEDFLRGRAQE